MRSPVIAFGLFAAAAVSPTLVGAAPTSPNLPTNGLGVPHVPNPADSAPNVPHVSRSLKHGSHEHERRANDSGTAGGNAYSGVSGSVSGGNTINDAGDEDNTITNMGASSGSHEFIF